MTKPESAAARWRALDPTYRNALITWVAIAMQKVTEKAPSAGYASDRMNAAVAIAFDVLLEAAKEPDHE